MKFVLFEKLSELEGKELIMFLLAAAVAACILVLLFVFKKHKAENAPALTKKADTRALVYGALCLSLSYVLSFIKLFSMPMGGSLTLCSLLPLAMYAWAFGPKAGFTAAFAYSLLQVIQGAWVVHPVQFVLDYFVAFTAFGLASLFPRCLPLGVGAAAQQGRDQGFADFFRGRFRFGRCGFFRGSLRHRRFSCIFPCGHIHGSFGCGLGIFRRRKGGFIACLGGFRGNFGIIRRVFRGRYPRLLPGWRSYFPERWFGHFPPWPFRWVPG